MPPLETAILTVTPVILVLVLGKVLATRQLIDANFINTASKLAYKVALPVLLFTNISQANVSQLVDLPMIAAGAAATLITFVGLVLITGIAGVTHVQRGVVVQAGFRSNMGIVGLALCARLLGDSGITLASVYLSVMIPVYNLLSIWVLLLFSSVYRSSGAIFWEVLKSPLIVAVMVAVPIAYFSVPMPAIVMATGEIISQITLPLALLCIGGSLKFRDLVSRWRIVSGIVLSKCFLYPAIVFAFAQLFNVTGETFTVLLLLSLAPTATAAFPAVKQLGGDAELTADAIALTTVLSLPVYIIVITFLL